MRLNNLIKQEEKLELNLKALLAVVKSMCDTELEDKICHSE